MQPNSMPVLPWKGPAFGEGRLHELCSAHAALVSQCGYSCVSAAPSNMAREELFPGILAITHLFHDSF